MDGRNRDTDLPGGVGADRLTRAVAKAGAERPTVGQVAEVLAEADVTDLDRHDAFEAVEAAFDAGVLVEDPDAGMFGGVYAPREKNAEDSHCEDDATPRVDTPEPVENGGFTTSNGQNSDEIDGWEDVDFASPVPGEWPADLLNREQWMGRRGKLPFTPWGNRNADLECTKPEHDTDTTAACDCDARWKWGHTGHYVDGETAAIAEDDPRLDGRVFLQQENDPFAFVDGDDVRCPETGEVHPAFVEILERLGLTYADISTSGSGSHANYRGELPNELKQATFAIDDEPWGANDKLPEVEIYDGKHVCVATGEHVPGTPLEVRMWDDDSLRDVLEEYGELPEEPTPTERRNAFDAEKYDPDATENGEVTDDIRDVFAALDNLDARDVAEKTIVDEWKDPVGTEARAFIPIWAPAGYDGTANFANRKSWTDSGTRGGYGGAVVMGAIDCPDIAYDETDAHSGKVEGSHWWRAVSHLRDLGFPIPEYVGDGAASDDETRDPRDVKVTPDPEVAWRAADAVVPNDLDEALPLEAATDGERAGWECPATGAVVDVVRAARSSPPQ